MDKSNFEVGRMVRLRHGGPQMTIIRKLDNGEVEFAWFDEQYHWQTAVCHENALSIWLDADEKWYPQMSWVRNKKAAWNRITDNHTA